jgi:hypothetical protein
MGWPITLALTHYLDTKTKRLEGDPISPEKSKGGSFNWAAALTWVLMAYFIYAR